MEFNQQNQLNEPIKSLMHPQRYYAMPPTEGLMRFVQRQNARQSPGAAMFPYGQAEPYTERLYRQLTDDYSADSWLPKGLQGREELFDLTQQVHGVETRRDTLQQAINKGWRPPPPGQITPRGSEIFERKFSQPPRLTAEYHAEGGRSYYDPRDHRIVVTPFIYPGQKLLSPAALNTYEQLGAFAADDPALTAVHEADHASGSRERPGLRANTITYNAARELPPSLADVANIADVVKHHSGITLDQPLSLGKNTQFTPEELRRSLEQVGYYNSPMTAAEAFTRRGPARTLLQQASPLPPFHYNAQRALNASVR
jgi:hypothetical protein